MATTMSVKPDLLVDARVGTAEGPVWNRRTSQLVWTDIPGESIHFTDIETGEDTHVDVGTRIGSIVPRAGGGYVMATCQEYRLTDDDVTHQVGQVIVTDEPRVKFNDGKCDPAGRFFAGTSGRDGRVGTGALYRLDGDLSPSWCRESRRPTAWAGARMPKPSTTRIPRPTGWTRSISTATPAPFLAVDRLWSSPESAAMTP